MKVLNKKKFMEQGVVLFCKGTPWAFDSLCLKGDTIYSNNEAVDFFYTDLCIIDSQGSDDLFDRLPEMLDLGKSFEINKNKSRDGCFNDENIFLVYEVSDLSFLYCVIKILCQWSNLNEKNFDKKMESLKKGCFNDSTHRLG